MSRKYEHLSVLDEHFASNLQLLLVGIGWKCFKLWLLSAEIE